MKWIKITENNKPSFNETVFLMEKRGDNIIKVDAGSLKSINADGLNWSISSQSLFGYDNLFSKDTTVRREVFNPTYYCLIEIPED